MSIKIPKVPLFGKQIKVWGWTHTVALTDKIHVALAYLREGGFSSKHIHRTLDNRFVVISGKLRIDIWRGETEEFVDLRAGDVLDVEAGVPHRMTALEESFINEIYWSSEPILNPEDIVREDTGGIKQKTMPLPTFWPRWDTPFPVIPVAPVSPDRSYEVNPFCPVDITKTNVTN